MSARQRLALFVGLCTLGAAGLCAHVRLVNFSTGAPLWWQTSSAIPITINATGSDNLTDNSHFTALRNAIDEWNSIAGTSMQLVEDRSPAAQARTDWASTSVHLIFFDETNSSGFFPGGSGTVAITPVWFFSNGRISDADVLFNGNGFAFSTSRQAGRYDIGAVGVHELGHLLGLDHSGWAGSSMYPFVAPALVLQRSLSSDERVAMRAIYPRVAHGTISGTIRRASDGSLVRGAHVVARDMAGRPYAAGLTGTGGVFQLRGLAAGSYTLYSTPLDFPVSSANLSAGWTIDTDFESTDLGLVVLAEGQTRALGDLPVGADVLLSLGRNSDRYPVRCREGTTTSIVIRGSGLVTGSTLTASDPNIVVTPTSWFSSQVSANVTVPVGSPVGHVDLTVVDPGGQRSILAAALELTPLNPSVTLVSPNQGDIAGGAALTIFGTEFNPGCRIVMGGEIYVDGRSGGCTVLNATTITLTTRSSVSGLTDVVAIDSTGVEGRKLDGFEFLSVPVLDTLFPLAGSAAGGTELRLVGQNFSVDSQVRINGVAQPSVLLSSPQKLVVITEPGVVGGPYSVEVENPGGGIATAFFSYVPGADPSVTGITPGSGPTSGGDVLRIDGANFGTNLRVTFGANPNSGLGGSTAALLTVIDASTLEVTTPARPAGLATMIVEDLDTAQAAIVTSGFTFLGASGGGGGGCHTVPVQGPPDPWQVLGSLLWFASMAFGLRLVKRGAVASAVIRRPVIRRITATTTARHSTLDANLLE